MEDTKNVKKAQLSEEELEQAAGGIGSANECWFKPKGHSMYFVKNTGFGEAMECDAGCFGFAKQCRCHGTNNCVNRMHLITIEDTGNTSSGAEFNRAYPAPKSEANHSILSIQLLT